MRRLNFSYTLRLGFSQPVRRHAFQLRCMPLERGGQHVERVSRVITPDVRVSEAVDGFGNTICFGLAEAEHSSFSVAVRGAVLLDEPHLPDSALSAAKYLPQTDFTRPGTALRALLAKVPAAEGALPRARAMMHAVRSEIAYVPASTTADTTAEAAAGQGCGVCQDHAQILLSLLRMEGIPCRYVSGLLLGEGRTHAWVEAFLGGCWVGLDATNGMVVRDTHIALAVGRDHTDCELNRGVMLGSGAQTQTVQVNVTAHPILK